MPKVKRNPAAEKVVDLIIENYKPQRGQDVQEALKEIFGPIFEKKLNAKMDAHLGYDKNA